MVIYCVLETWPRLKLADIVVGPGYKIRRPGGVGGMYVHMVRQEYSGTLSEQYLKVSWMHSYTVSGY